LRGLGAYIVLFIKGLCIGAADFIPGVSGGTIAFITGIYEKFIFSLAAFDRDAIVLMRRGHWKSFWIKINGWFFVTVLLGIATSLVFLARLILFLHLHYGNLILAFFFGVIVISICLTLREIKRWTVGAFLAIGVGIVITYVIGFIQPFRTPDALWFVFIAGFASACAMLIPGVSGIFALSLLGKYQYITKAVLGINVISVAVFLLGSILGLITFSRLLATILKKYHSIAVALFAGLMIGSLNKVWPWRISFEFIVNSKGEQVPVLDSSILPWEYVTLTGKDPLVFQTILLMSFGMFTVVFIERLVTRIKTKL
jgi:putative membrane protein